ncbi:SEC-C domain-containing protein [bacterium]|nr:SEC-C domain-containing protein [bacterium]MBU1982893.1 SEC-C domain-containing protein [bacterium]
MTENDVCLDIIHAQFNELVEHYQGLSLHEDQPGRWIVRGDLTFRAEYNGVEMAGTFSVLITLPDDYPASPPKICETGEQIPREADFHVYPTTGNFCLGAQIEVRRKFAQNPDLLHFVKDQVVHFLYALVYRSWFGKMPWGELSHSGKGILEYYNELFHVSGHKPTLHLLLALHDRVFHRTWMCPCGSGRKLRKCHGPQLKELVAHCTPEDVLSDMKTILDYVSPKNTNADARQP